MSLFVNRFYKLDLPIESLQSEQKESIRL